MDERNEKSETRREHLKLETITNRITKPEELCVNRISCGARTSRDHHLICGVLYMLCYAPHRICFAIYHQSLARSCALLCAGLPPSADHNTVDCTVHGGGNAISYLVACACAQVKHKVIDCLPHTFTLWTCALCARYVLGLYIRCCGRLREVHTTL